jgi:predicted Zn finger-like uncharacterized protein
MKAQCPQCGKLYQIDADKLPAAGIRVKCKQCQAPFDIRKQYNDSGKGVSAETRTPEEIVAEKYIQEKNENAVIKVLTDGIMKYAVQKKFREAERLREQLIRIAPMALSEIMQTEDVIEREKLAAMDSKKMKPWADLYAELSKSEAAAFYFALVDVGAKAGIPVFEQGKFDDRLYFIRSGRLSLSYFDNETGKNINYATLQQGDIAGVEAFFTFSSHGSTLTPIEDAEISFLGKESYEKLIAENPIIESKLCNYGIIKKKTCNLAGKTGSARRAYKRYRTLLDGSVRMMDKDGKLTDQVTKVNIVDISGGGLCYLVKNMKHNEAAQLHKSWIHIDISCKKAPMIPDVRRTARVVSVQFHPFGECSIHVRFDKPIEIRAVIEMARNPI